MLHPCLCCGACCAAFRVAFHWSEASPEQAGITPPELTEPLDPHRVNMRGTQQRRPRCVALRGQVGHDANCSIYEQRPSPCRDLKASFENGLHSPQCDKARAIYSLPPLQAGDWLALLDLNQLPMRVQGT